MHQTFILLSYEDCGKENLLNCSRILVSPFGFVVVQMVYEDLDALGNYADAHPVLVLNYEISFTARENTKRSAFT